jgi:hypothetical protein
MPVRLAIGGVVVDGMLSPKGAWKAAKWASVTVRLGKMKISPSLRFLSTGGGVEIRVE